MAAESGSKGQPHKSHRSRQAGPSAKKKKNVSSNFDNENLTVEQRRQRNPKAFAFNSSVKAKRLQARTVEKEQRRLHVPTIDRTYGEPAPYIVLVHGPSKVGKSLLIKSLVKHYTKHNLPEVQGPITIVSGKQRRLQFVECPNEINGMIDASKFADLALLLIDGSYGFEMETLEFLNILDTHGRPNLMGVLTHLDKFKDVKKLKKKKQQLKHRFWTETYQGAKLFYLSGLIHGKYLKREVHNLARFISVMKFHASSWRSAHPYLVADRFEDVTPPEKVQKNRKCDRNVTLYGYLRGCNLKKGAKVHIAGVGDYSLAGVTSLADPCPLPSAAKKKGLRDKEKLFYAPMSGVGELVYDKDAVYININDHFVQFTKTDEENEELNRKGKEPDVGEVLVRSLQNTKYSVDEKLDKSFIDLFGRKPNVFSEAQDGAKDEQKSIEWDNEMQTVDNQESGKDSSSGETDADDAEGIESFDQYERVNGFDNMNSTMQPSSSKGGLTEHVEYYGGRMRRKAVFGGDADPGDSDEDANIDDEDESDANDVYGDSENLSSEDNQTSGSDVSDDDDDEGHHGEHMGNASKWKEFLTERTMSRQHRNLMQVVYGAPATLSTSINRGQEHDDSEEEEFFKPKQEGKKNVGEGTEAEDVNVEDCSKFVRSPKSWKERDVVESIRDRFVTGDWSKASLRNQISEFNPEDGNAVFGDFEDLETGEKYGNGEMEDFDKKQIPSENDAVIEERRLKKLALRAKFDSQYPFTFSNNFIIS
ncbi:hypothetical protein SAY86_006122 [Trapa natans]|uniref:Bms1-type G domain-containing protein n=1 Tax=Trapa natans TaxID=22666 RepID=A0AAN7QT27_TRANT|nr:hypothetical protein SAY86_006122 [Trapa natans]